MMTSEMMTMTMMMMLMMMTSDVMKMMMTMTMMMVMMIIDDASADDIISMCMYLFPKGKGIVYESEIIHFGHKRQPSFLTTATFFKLYFGSKHFITFQIGEIPFLVKC